MGRGLVPLGCATGGRRQRRAWHRSGRGTAQLFVNSEKYGAPIDQLAATTGFDEAAPDQVVKLWPGQHNTRVYQAIASTGTSLSFDYVKIVPVNEGKES